jgi:hypothetical protein
MISGVPYYEETSTEFAEFPDLPIDDPDGDLAEAYAIALLSPNTFRMLISETNPHLLIKSFYGSLVVKPQIEQGISDRVISIPLSPFLFMILPPSRKEAVEDIENDSEKRSERFDYQIMQSIRADVSGTTNPITPFISVKNRFLQKRSNEDKEL